MWSIYDTCILLTGVFVSLIAVIPRKDIPLVTRAAAAGIGLGIIGLSLLLGNLRYFRYPSIVFLGPPVSLLALVAIAWVGLGSTDSEQSTTAAAEDTGDATGSAPLEPISPQAIYPPGPGLNQPGEITGVSGLSPQLELAPASTSAAADRTAVWAEVHDPNTGSERLGAIAGQYPEFVSAIVKHPNCYPALTEWARASGLLSAGYVT